MYISCLAADHDGTLAHQGVVDEATTNALIASRWRQPERGSASAPRQRGTHRQLRSAVAGTLGISRRLRAFRAEMDMGLSVLAPGAKELVFA